jgi:two-component system response regulator HydG
VADAALQPAERLVAVAEQRFLPDAFAHVSAARARELNALLTLTARIALSAAAPRVPLAAADASEPSRAQSAPSSSTALPTGAPRHSFPNIVGSSRALRAALARLDAAIDSDLPLLLSGETGVGKELFARAVAESGPRRGRPFVAVNCAAISSSLFEAEFFGHERGAFTGADRRRSGVFVQADTGVLLLDEIGELPLAQQAVLLRALETRRVRPLGAEREQNFDVRLIAASNRDLERAASEGSFRRDLLYRINVVEVRIPALRERAEDIEVLASHFLRAQGSALTISPQALALLRAYSWPGNVRELAHTMQRLSALHDQRIDVAQLPRQIRGARNRATPARANPPKIQDPKLEVLHTLSQTGGNISHAARVLGLTRHGLKKRMLRLGLRGPSQGNQS